MPAAVAVVQVGLRPLGHGEAAPIASLVAADHALRLGLVQHGDIADAITLHERHPGIPAVRAVLAHADGRHESVGETRMMFNLRALGYQIEPQRLVPGLRYRVDGKLKGHDVYIEFDGMKKYLPTGPLSTADELAARRAIAEEKARQDAISATGAVFVRFTWADLASLGTMAAKMRDAIRRAELLRSAGASVR